MLPAPFRIPASLLLVGSLVTACSDGPSGIEDAEPTSAPLIEAVEFDPWVVTDRATDTVRLRVYLTDRPAEVMLQVRDASDDLVLERTEERVSVDGALRSNVVAEVWEGRIAASDLLAGFTPERGSNFVGRVFATNRLGEASTVAFLAFDEQLAEVVVETPAPGVQLARHVVNVVLPGDAPIRLSPFVEPIDRIVAALETIGVDPDLLAVTGPMWKTRERGSAFYASIRNDTRGIGADVIDMPAIPGSAFAPLAALPSVDGVLVVRDPARFDLAASNAVHEIGHRFLVYVDEVYGDPGGAHWPVSDLARGIMGYQIGDGTERFRFRIVPHPDGGFQYAPAPLPRHFNTMELYLMGLLPPEEVGDFRVFDTDPRTLPTPGQAGVRIQAPVRVIDADSVIAAVGPREPSFEDAPKVIRIATVVLSRGRPLTPEEMAYFDMAAARGEATEEVAPLEVSRRRDEPTIVPFHPATGGRGRLDIRVW